ncbi:MAG: bifunctional 5,10-methylenetetrahydrofolate dehydrogenase/5,10-methenyltetrahydrofolate cyclohydrolase [Oscillospiraceae bacterium]|nr:bifunctional 5,10-methylenetetrahydrofolate dehydrogenase/5,10-methenyltetrahydrofolate cyclohydrolase [Oscillospiraceae bacterium]
MAEILKGAPVAAALTEELSRRSAALRDKGVAPCLAIVRLGARDDDLAYERAAMKRCDAAGIAVRQMVLPEDADTEAVLDVIRDINEDDAVHSCLIMRPLPRGVDEAAVCAALAPQKDADGITPGAMAAVYEGRGGAPCTAEACLTLLRHYGVAIGGKRAVVVGRSAVIGRPAAMLLLGGNATVTICHSHTADLPAIVREADIVIAALGKAEALGAECFRAGQTVVDVGIHYSQAKGRMVGDVDFDAAAPIVDAITPVPGGVGAVTTAVLCRHVIEAAEKSL